MKKTVRFLSVAAAVVASAASLFTLAACDTKYPEVEITYKFDGKEYKVEYILSRRGAPQTVQHFIELADAGYYDGTVIHDYKNDGAFLYGGGYTIDEHGDLVEKDYWTEVQKLEREMGITFTQSVFSGEARDPLYTVRGEFKNNGVSKNSKSYYHNAQGTLVMYYMDKGKSTENTYVTTLRNDGKEYQEDGYAYNSATSLFYTYTTTAARTDLDNDYCAFGRTKDFSKLQALLDAVSEYASSRDVNDPFFQTKTMVLNQYDPFQEVREAKIEAEYTVPTVPIYIQSVKVKKY